VLVHLTEAEEALQKLIIEISSDREYDYGNYRVDMEHLYHHVNTEWNARDATDATMNECSEEDFRRWRQFPPDIELLS
jgi:hypothetical protein